LLRGLEGLALDVVLTNLAPARDAASQWLVHRIDEQPVSLIGTPARVGPVRLGLRDLLATQPLIAPTRETGLRAAFDALAARLEVTPILAAEVDDMAMIRLLARADAGLAIIPPIVVRDELQSGALVEAARLDGISETFFAVTQERRFPNPLLAEVLHR
jgi:LysR family transcriptional regulator, transcriptional activator of nhaA